MTRIFAFYPLDETRNSYCNYIFKTFSFSNKICTYLMANYKVSKKYKGKQFYSSFFHFSMGKLNTVLPNHIYQNFPVKIKS